MANEKDLMIYLSVPDEGKAQLVKAILAYEAASRGLSRGQALLDLVKKAAHTSDYPDEVKARLSQIEEQTRDRAIKASLVATEEKVA